MTTAKAPPGRFIVRSLTPGRLRLELPSLTTYNRSAYERELRSLTGVTRAETNPLTASALLRFDSGRVSSSQLLENLEAAQARAEKAPLRTPPPERPIFHETLPSPRVRRARIPVRGLDRDPQVGRLVLEHLARRKVTASASPLTGRVLLEYDPDRHSLLDLTAELAELELPPLPQESWPEHPLDSAPLIRAGIRAAGTLAGLGFIASLGMLGRSPGLPTRRAAARVAGLLGIAQSFPAGRRTADRVLGETGSTLAFYAPVLIGLTYSGSILGLATTGLEAWRAISELLARRQNFRRYEERLGDAPSPLPGSRIRVDTNRRLPLPARILEGKGTATGRDGLPVAAVPNQVLGAGSRLFGGPFLVELLATPAHLPLPRRTPPRASLADRYLTTLNLVSLANALATLAFTRSPARAFTSLLMVNPRAAGVGAGLKALEANHRTLRAGAISVSTRPDRHARRPDVLLLDSPRILTEGYELSTVRTLGSHLDRERVLALAAGTAVAAGSPWGAAFPPSPTVSCQEGDFDGRAARAVYNCEELCLRPWRSEDTLPETVRPAAPDEIGLILERAGVPLALLVLRPRLRAGVRELVATCRRRKVRLLMVSGGDRRASEALAARAKVELYHGRDRGAISIIDRFQKSGAIVGFCSDRATSGEAFARADLAIGVSAGRGSHFAARADFLAPDPGVLAAIVEAGARGDRALTDSLFFSLCSNLFGLAWNWHKQPGVERASNGIHVATLAAIATTTWRLRGGERPRSLSSYLADPRPERWASRSPAQVLEALASSPQGLSLREVEARALLLPSTNPRSELLAAVVDQLRTPIPGILAGAGCLALALGAPLDFALITATIVVNVAAGTWQELKTNEASQALEKIASPSARTLRDGVESSVQSKDLVVGDVLLLASGEQVSADARLLEVNNLQVDESLLTGESLPVSKAVSGGSEDNRIVLAGSAVLAGSGKAVVVAVGRQTRMGATAAALETDEQQGTLSARLGDLFRQMLPLAVAGGGLVVISGILRGRALAPTITTAATIGLAALPEGLPLLAGMGEAAVARRLQAQNATVRRLSSVEALGRVDVACTDKTGTLTEGKLSLQVVACHHTDSDSTESLAPELLAVLETAALASPHPEALDAATHPTDGAVMRAAESAGLGASIRAERQDELPFEAGHAFHATVVAERLCVKGAPEELLGRCSHYRHGGEDVPLTEKVRARLETRIDELASRGLRILMVAQGSVEETVRNPGNLSSLGFIGISDPLRARVKESVARCQQAGIRVIMLTGDHPATARAIARQAGLSCQDEVMLSGSELNGLDDAELDARLSRAQVVARATPLDKLRIIESLQRSGHVVAMTGDGVNDAPSLRLADVGVAMGQTGTEVARQAADLVLADDDFSTLVEALVEGRSFWRNLRRALGLLIGGNMGELGLVVGATAMGFSSPLNTAQILAVNLLTDALPALSVILQRPEDRVLHTLARETGATWDRQLKLDVVRRGLVTTVPSLLAYLSMLRGDSPLAEARSVAFASIVGTQLAQTLDTGWSRGTLTPSVVSAVGGSLGLLTAFLTIPPLKRLLSLTTPGLPSLSRAGIAAVAAVALNRAGSASTSGWGCVH